MGRARRPRSFIPLLVIFCLFLAFLYGPMVVMFVFSFQGQYGSITLPFKGPSLYWWKRMLSGSEIGDLGPSVVRSLVLALIVMALTGVFSTMLGMGFRKKFRHSTLVFYLVLAGIMTPGVLISLGTNLLWRSIGWNLQWFTAGLGVHVIWTLPFGFLLMLSVFNRFDPQIEEAGRDLGATEWQLFRRITLPIILFGIVGAGLFGFTLSYDEFARSSLVTGARNTLPLTVFASLTRQVKPSLFALGMATTIFSFVIIGLFLAVASRLAAKAQAGRVAERREAGVVPGRVSEGGG